MLLRTLNGDFVSLSSGAKVRILPTSSHGRGGAQEVERARTDGALLIPESVGDLEKLASPLVPSTAVVLAITPTGSVTGHPVAAFRVLRAGAAEPVFAVTPPEGAVLFQGIGAHGLVRLSDGALYPNLETAKASVLGGPEPHPAEPEVEVVEPMPKVAGGRRAR